MLEQLLSRPLTLPDVLAKRTEGMINELVRDLEERIDERFGDYLRTDDFQNVLDEADLSSNKDFDDDVQNVVNNMSLSEALNGTTCEVTFR